MENIYTFKEPLKEGIILERQHSFIMMVEYEGKTYRCHCPCITSIGHIDIKGRPCLLSGPFENRATTFTVEAISLNRPEETHKSWIGINQTASNRYLEFYLKTNQLFDMIDTSNLVVQREQTIGKSRLDFKVGDTYIENKTIVRLDMPIPSYIKTKTKRFVALSDHFYKHVNELNDALQSHERAILVASFLYDNKDMMRYTDMQMDDVKPEMKDAFSHGVESYQIDYEIDPYGVRLVGCYKLS